MKTQAEFQKHIKLHQIRVVKLGLELAKEHYPGLSLSDLEAFLKFHDASKTLQSQLTLKQFGYNHEKLPLERLFKFYGFKKSTPLLRTELQQVVTDINTVDENISRHFFHSLGTMDPKTQTAFYEIEKVADLVDRSLDPVAAEEFGHPMILASEFIPDLHLAKHSLWLESLYPMVTKHLSF